MDDIGLECAHALREAGLRDRVERREQGGRHGAGKAPNVLIVGQEPLDNMACGGQARGLGVSDDVLATSHAVVVMDLQDPHVALPGTMPVRMVTRWP